MADPFVGEVRLFAGTFAPQGWALCDGRLLAISQSEVLYALIGTTYGGDGQTTFGLPDLRSRCAVHQGSGSVIGQVAGTEGVTLTAGQNPAHSHTVTALTTGTSVSPSGAVYAGNAQNFKIYKPGPPSAAMNAAMVTATGGLPHENRMPYLAVTFIIALEGVFPSQN